MELILIESYTRIKDKQRVINIKKKTALNYLHK